MYYELIFLTPSSKSAPDASRSPSFFSPSSPGPASIALISSPDYNAFGSGFPKGSLSLYFIARTTAPTTATSSKRIPNNRPPETPPPFPFCFDPGAGIVVLGAII